MAEFLRNKPNDDTSGLYNDGTRLYNDPSVGSEPTITELTRNEQSDVACDTSSYNIHIKGPILAELGRLDPSDATSLHYDVRIQGSEPSLPELTQFEHNDVTTVISSYNVPPIKGCGPTLAELGRIDLSDITSDPIGGCEPTLTELKPVETSDANIANITITDPTSQRTIAVVTIPASALPSTAVPTVGASTSAAAAPGTRRLRSRRLELEESDKLLKTEYIRKMRKAVRDILQCSNATAIRCRGSIGYSCCFCSDHYPDPAELKLHNIHEHDKEVRTFLSSKHLTTFYVKMDITYLKCILCNDFMQTISELVDHLNTAHKKDIITDIKKRIFPFKFETEELRCCECPSTYHAFKALQEHMHSHYPNFVCDTCGAGFIIKSALNVHKATHESGSFKCDHCPKVLDSLNKKKMHEKFVHVSDLRFKCGYCDERFSIIHAREKHYALVHGIEHAEYKCHACGKILANRSSLRTHIKRHHLLLRLHECPECEMRFYTPNELQRHMPKHSQLRDFKCEVCDKAFGRKKTLKEHMRIHLNDRRFKCDYCDQAFVQKCSWKGHMRSKHEIMV